jgi:hypothetical protein
MQHQLQPSRNSWRQYVSLPGVASLSFGAWLYLCATSCDAVAKRLETAKPVAKLSGEHVLPPAQQLQQRPAPNLLH